MGHQTIKIISFVAAGLGLAVIVLYLILARPRPSIFKVIKIGETSINVEIVDSLFAQQRGLSNRPGLAADSGMLFTYNNKAIRHFWMPNMNFPLDVLWIADGIVVGLQTDIQPNTPNGKVTRFQSNVPVDMVLEINSGCIKANNIKIGDHVDIN